MRLSIALAGIIAVAVLAPQSAPAQISAPPAHSATAPPPSSELPPKAAERISPPLRNDDIIKLVQARLADSLIINTIRSSECKFDISPEGLARLQQAGVSDAVRQAMIEVLSQPTHVHVGEMEVAGEAMRARDYPRAVKEYTALLDRFPRSPEVYEGRAQAYYRWGRTDDALADYAEAIRVDPKSLFPLLIRANLYLQLNDLPLARRDLDQAIKLAPTATQPLRMRASVRDRQGDLQGALEDIDTAIRLEPNSMTFKLWRERLLRRMNSPRSSPLEGARQSPGTPKPKIPSPPEPPVYIIGGDVTAPVAVKTPEALYTPEARNARRVGKLKLEIVVDAEGNVTDVHELSPPLGLGLDESAVETIRLWKFKPALRNGKPVAVRVVLEFTFAPS